MELDRRKMKILSAIVSEYIRTGEPVGSKRVAQLLDTQAPAMFPTPSVEASAVQQAWNGDQKSKISFWP